MSDTTEPGRTEPGKTDGQQAEIGRGTPPGRVPSTKPEPGVQPDQRPVRETPDAGAPGGGGRAP